MIERIFIQNILFIEKLDIDLKKGFSAITGETGAGKSILFECIKFALGSKLSPNFVNNNAEASIILLEFDISNNMQVKQKLNDDMIEYDNDKLVIKKIFFDEKKSKIFVNDMPVSNIFVKQLSIDLVEYQGQHSQTILLDAKKHIDILDNYANLDDKKDMLASCYVEVFEIRKKLTDLEKRILNQEREKEYLSHIMSELTAIDPKEGEIEELTNIRATLLKEQKTKDYLKDAVSSINNSKIFDALNSAYKSLIRCDKEIIDLGSLGDDLDKITIELQDLKNSLEEKLSRNFEDKDQSSIENRLFYLKDMARKYRIQPEELHSFMKKTEEELASLNQLDITVNNLRKELLQKESEYLSHARHISKIREQCALKLESCVESELNDLKMEKTIFKVKIVSDENKMTSNGIDVIEFMATNNPGLPLAPLKDISSGGEISRFMLAIRVIITKLKSPPVIIFDEIDTGLGGAVASAVGEKIKLLSQNYQILVVTHHPQVAAKADQHYLVKKKFADNKTNMEIQNLVDNSRIEELARMISGSVVTDQGRNAAKALLDHSA